MARRPECRARRVVNHGISASVLSAPSRLPGGTPNSAVRSCRSETDGDRADVVVDEAAAKTDPDQRGSSPGPSAARCRSGPSWRQVGGQPVGMVDRPGQCRSCRAEQVGQGRGARVEGVDRGADGLAVGRQCGHQPLQTGRCRRRTARPRRPASNVVRRLSTSAWMVALLSARAFENVEVLQQ